MSQILDETELLLRRTSVTAAGWAKVAVLGNLQALDSAGPRVTDAGLVQMVKLDWLCRWLIDGVRIAPQTGIGHV